MVKPWFHPETGTLLLDDYASAMPSFARVMADAVVTDEELEEQAERVLSLFRRLEPILPPEAHEVATEALCELAVLNLLHGKRFDSA